MRIWFNHWFSAVYHIIRMIREGCTEEVYVIGSNKRSAAVYKSACDEWHVEPDGCTAEEYVRFCLDFCKEHQVDVFLPHRELVAIADHMAEFEAMGVKVFIGANRDTVRLLDDKAAAYAFFRERGFDCIPEIRMVDSVDGFIAACEELRSDDYRLCYKLNVDEGARSFRVIDERVQSQRALLEKPGSKVNMETALAVLRQYDFSIPVMVMPYLEGPEISADCLRTASGDLIIPRYKKLGRYHEVSFGKDVMDLCSRLMDAVGAELPVNIQIRMHKGKMFLLEINPRMSGGMQLSCKATGINFPAIAINKLLGVETPWAYPDRDNIRVAHVETPVCLDD